MASVAPATAQAPLSDPSIGTQHRHSPLGHSTARRPGPSSLPPSHDGKERNPPPPPSRRAASSAHPSSSRQTDRQSICPVPLCFLHTVPPRSQAAATPAPSLPPSLSTLESRYSRARPRALSINQPDRQTHTHTHTLRRPPPGLHPGQSCSCRASWCVPLPARPITQKTRVRACVRAHIHKRTPPGEVKLGAAWASSPLRPSMLLLRVVLDPPWRYGT